MSQFRDQLVRFVEPLKRRILMMLARAVVRTIYDDSGIQLAKVEVFSDEKRDKLERFQDYGLTCNPPVDSEAIVAFIGGNRNHGVVLRIDNREFRLKNLAIGEVALYTDEGDYIHFKRNRELHVRTNKWKLQGESDELMDILTDITKQLKTLADTLSNDTTNTIFGPMKLNSFATYTTIKSNVQALITKLEGLTA